MKTKVETSNEKPEGGKATSSPRFGFLRKMSSRKKKQQGSSNSLSKAEHYPLDRSLPAADASVENKEDEVEAKDTEESVTEKSLDVEADVNPDDAQEDGDNAAGDLPEKKILLTSQDSITIEARRTPKPDMTAHVDADARPHNPVASELFNASQDAVDTSIDEVGYETPDDDDDDDDEQDAEEKAHPIAQRDPACFSDPTPAKKKISLPTATVTAAAPRTPDQQQRKENHSFSGMIGTNFSSSPTSPRASSERRLSAERNYTVRERHGAEWQKLHDMFERNHGGSVPKLFDAPSSPRSSDQYAKSKATVGEIDSHHIKSVKELAKELNARSPKKAEEGSPTITNKVDMSKAPLAPTLAQ